MVSGDAEQRDELDLLEDAERLISLILHRGSPSEIKSLIEQEVPLWYQDDEGNSALHAACYVENVELVRSLIEKGAVWNAVDALSNTAADIALSLNNTECYRLIRDAGVRSEFLLLILSSQTAEEGERSTILRSVDSTPAGSTEAFLNTKLLFSHDANGQEVCLSDAGNGQQVGVMMGWEREIMEETVRRLCPSHAQPGMRVLNIGFGLGIIDTLFEELPVPPSSHVIVEPHPDVLRFMREKGWYERPNVTVFEGKWQDFVESERFLEGGGFDAVYTDTFSENYEELKKFFEYLPDLLSGPDAVFSFFNGLGATNATFYDVYTQVSELHLTEIGLSTEWFDVDVRSAIDRWSGTREYFSLPIYRGPLCRMREIG
ncbi:S-adenosyl-L-methionine-dependent methyltransferase [Sistotremastrum niveocremeum HHB9708]|uniref:S-adenosyl-L-methionine-dependent methyltransferase n=2 Tax=Sistotremastraceae TaxID=3402574 RepID=A0A165A6V4_9AGAM|nr:S-adenosyl-L-methionine-dependent methyltransferase [Sistotremastrum niveocremeum HHB9708]KZT43514.1 S-adenosyl-L-methionine-dependent methyltransferase [Sistotremastrum suecicum HHB10207 ss-3]